MPRVQAYSASSASWSNSDLSSKKPPVGAGEGTRLGRPVVSPATSSSSAPILLLCAIACQLSLPSFVGDLETERKSGSGADRVRLFSQADRQADWA